MFNSLTQSVKFDPEGKYIRTWCPELTNVPNAYIHDPWNMPSKMQEQVGVKIVPYNNEMKASTSQTDNYPKPIQCHKYTSVEAAKKMKRTEPKVKSVEPKSKEPKAKQSNLSFTKVSVKNEI